jgi:cytochrome c peroxidase
MGTYQSGVTLKESEVNSMVAFLKTLTGEYQGKLVTTSNSREHIHADDDDHHH